MKIPKFKRLSLCRSVEELAEQYRLYLEYGMIACLITLTVISANLWSSKDSVSKELESVTTRLTQVETWREADLNRIRGLVSERVQDGDDLAKVIERIRDLGVHSKEIESRLIELEKSNMTFRTFLEQNYNGSVECLLSEECN